MAIDLPQPLIVTAWMRRFANALLARANVPADARTAAAPWPDIVADALGQDEAGWCGGPCDALLATALTETIVDLGTRYGADPARWRWGEAHQAVFAHPILRAVPVLGRFAEGRIEAPGGETTVDRGGLRPGGMESVHGAGFRGVYDLADLDHARFALAPGQSGNPLSGRAKNLLQRWRDGVPLMLGADVAAPSAHIRLVPAGERL